MFEALTAKVEKRKKLGGYSQDAADMVEIYQSLALLTHHLIGKRK